MKNLFLLPTTCLATIAAALALDTPSSSPAVFSVPIQRKAVERPHIRDRRRRRDDTVQVTLDNEETLYFANVSIGTPQQNFRLHIDTGSSDLWVNARESDLCTQNPSACSQSGEYSANASSTYQYLNNDFNITYVDGSHAVGDYVKDTLSIGNLTIQNFQFGVGYTSTSPQGILGIGYPINEVQVNNAREQPYNNLPAAMANTNVIATNAYSLWLNDLDSNTGSILFGGVDSAKYIPPLSTLPIISEFGQYAEFIIALTAVGQNGNEGSIITNQAIPVLLDSGSSLTYLPDNIVQSIYTAYNAVYIQNEGAAIVDCSLQNSQGSIDFTFSGVTISVALNELVILSSIQNGRETCIFGISPSGNSQPVLGDTFLRSAYVVYDLSDNTISLATTNFNTTQHDIQPIPSSSGIPGATPVANAVTSVTGLQTGIGRIGNGGVIGSTGGAAAMVTPLPSLKYGVAAAGLGFALAAL